MPDLTRKEVEDIALLARIHLEPSELDQMQRELGAILEIFAALTAVDTTDVVPMTHAVPLDSPLRADEPVASLSSEVALAAVPKRDGDLIVVPAIISSTAGLPGSER